MKIFKDHRGRLHRLRGPARVLDDGTREYWQYGHLLYRILPDGTEESIRAAPPKPHGGDTWRPVHSHIPEPQFRELWDSRLKAALGLRDAEQVGDLGLDQILKKLLATRGPRILLAMEHFGPKRGRRWLSGANVQELLVLALSGDPAILGRLQAAGERAEFLRRDNPVDPQLAQDVKDPGDGVPLAGPNTTI